MFAGMLAFDVLDRLTGDWTVTNSDWLQGFVAVVIQVIAVTISTRDTQSL